MFPFIEIDDTFNYIKRFLLRIFVVKCVVWTVFGGMTYFDQGLYMPSFLNLFFYALYGAILFSILGGLHAGIQASLRSILPKKAFSFIHLPLLVCLEGAQVAGVLFDIVVFNLFGRHVMPLNTWSQVPLMIDGTIRILLVVIWVVMAFSCLYGVYKLYAIIKEKNIENEHEWPRLKQISMCVGGGVILMIFFEGTYKIMSDSFYKPWLAIESRQSRLPQLFSTIEGSDKKRQMSVVKPTYLWRSVTEDGYFIQE